MQNKNPIEQLLDVENNDTIYLKNNQNGQIEAFEQMALIPYDKNIYAILVSKKDYDAGNFENTALVYKIDQKRQVLDIVEDENTVFEVFDIYDAMFEEGQE